MTTPSKSELREARRQTDELFEIVREDAFYERPIPERHRIIFYLGHLEAFDWNLVARHALDLPSFHSTFDRLFAFGIDPPAGQLPDDTPADWPAIEEVERYNRCVRETVDRALPNVPEEFLHAAIEHRLMHAETLAYILHQLPFEQKWSGPAPALGGGCSPAGQMIEIPVGRVQLGCSAGAGFAWDNEYEAHIVDVPAFAIGQYKITNGEYLEFVRAGGAPPFFWTEHEGAWFYRGMFAEIPLPLDAPVYVTKCQAEAYARACGLALPTEAQFQRAASGLPDRYITGVRIDPANPNHAYLTVSGFARRWIAGPTDPGVGHVFETQNGGQVWSDITGNLADVPTDDVVYENGKLVVATDFGVFMSSNDGTTWARFGSHLPNVVVDQLTLAPNGVLVAATHGRGVWTIPTR